MKNSKSTDHHEMERNTLRLLCSVILKPPTRHQICRMLDSEVFQDPLYRVVFEEISALGTLESRRLRQVLPARVTNRGFPQFDLPQLLAPYEVNETEMEQLFQSAFYLLDKSHPDEEPQLDFNA
jgi:hypothetical protein